MKGYPQAFKAMDLVAEHRLRVLHASWAFIHKEDPRAGAAAAKEAAQVRPAQPSCFPVHSMCMSHTSPCKTLGFRV